MPTHNPIQPATKVWDISVRLFHWITVIVFTFAYFSGDDAGEAHEYAGYFIAVLAIFRCWWGLAGSYYARFSQFVVSPKMLGEYLNTLIIGKERRYIGHNPLGGVMILFLLLNLLMVPFTGWLLTTDWGWGNELAEQLHILATNITLTMIFFHIAGVIYMSIRQRENLPKAMITGRKQPTNIEKSR